MKQITIDIKDMVLPEDIHECIKQELDFPEYYGKNLDALYDILTEIHEDICICLNYEREESEQAYAYHQRLKQVLLDAEEENPHLYLKL